MPAVVALKVAEVDPAATVTDAGTASNAFVSVSVTAAPPVGAALVSVTVQVLEAFGPRLDGLHASDDNTAEFVRLMVAVLELLLKLAVMIEL
jgi:hypothetical protein